MEQKINKYEIWKPILGFDGYEISNFGRVMSYRTTNRLTDTPKRILVPSVQSGYAHVGMQKNKKRIWKAVHRLVLEAFKGANPPNMVACHKDGNPLNNHLGNLKWDTQKNNCLEAKFGKHTKKQLVDAIGLVIARKLTYKEIGKKTQMSVAYVGCIATLAKFDLVKRPEEKELEKKLNGNSN